MLLARRRDLTFSLCTGASRSSESVLRATRVASSPDIPELSGNEHDGRAAIRPRVCRQAYAVAALSLRSFPAMLNGARFVPSMILPVDAWMTYQRHGRAS